MEINPYNDGIDHINIYSKGKTKLGKDLSNFSHTPFTHKKYGHFESVEGLWYYLLTGKQFENLRELYGFEAKKKGRQYLEQVKWSEIDESEVFQEDIKEGIRQKLREHKDILRELCKTGNLPLHHYYVYYSKKNTDEQGRPTYTVRGTGHSWVIDEIERIRDVSLKFLEKRDSEKTHDLNMN